MNERYFEGFESETDVSAIVKSRR